MPQTRHTPGPWEYVENDDNEKDAVKTKGCGGTIVADGWHIARIWKDSDQLKQQYKANAALIAAAPALLDALTNLAESAKAIDDANHAGLEPCACTYSLLYQRINEARATINQATGREGG